MPSVARRGRYWRARVRIKGVQFSRTFDTEVEARSWATEEERRLIAGEPAATDGLTIGALFDRYVREVSPTKSNLAWETIQLRALSRQLSGKVSDIDGARLAEWRDLRLRQVSPGSVNRDLGLLGAVFTRAIKEWRLPILVNPVHQIMRPRNPPHRTRRARGH